MTRLQVDGVPLGVGEPIPASGVWIPKDCPSSDCVPDLVCCESNWGSATTNPDAVGRIVDRDIGLKRIRVCKGGLQEATKRWGSRVAVGKFGLVQVPGKKDRLIGDSSICGVTDRIKMLERIFNPTPDDVDSSFRSRHLLRRFRG